MEKSKKIITNVLLAFVLVSVGFALGKHYGRWQSDDTPPKEGSSEEAGKPKEVVHVYYMHATKRCVSCNAIEKMTKALLDKDFAKELADGRIQFSVENFQENEKLGKAFDIPFSCVVVAKEVDGKVVKFNRLEKVWDCFKDPPAFDKFLKGEILKYEDLQ